MGPLLALTPEMVEAVSATLTAAGTALNFLLGSKTFQDREKAFELKPEAKRRSKLSPAHRILVIFGLIFASYGALAIHRFWPQIKKQEDLLLTALGLFFIMLLGMIVQVVSSNYKNSREMLDISGEQLVYPMLFAPIVYYPIWILSSSNSFGMFSWYAAFLNGYFWESVVSSARLPGDMRQDPRSIVGAGALTKKTREQKRNRNVTQ